MDLKEKEGVKFVNTLFATFSLNNYHTNKYVISPFYKTVKKFL
jgi:hypothetical protein